MLSYNFDYYQPKSIDEAVGLYQTLKAEEKKPIYYSGGTEIITLGRLNLIKTGAVIDLKGIPECMEYKLNNHQLIIGSALSLNTFEENRLFPLLTLTSKEIADYTSRNKITLGGNICGQIFYREAVLPFLLTDSYVTIAGPNGIRKAAINEIFYHTLQLEEGEFLVQLATEEKLFTAPHLSVKKRKQWDTGYPLITVAALKKDEEIRFAFSGLCPYPFRSKQIENILNSPDLSYKDRISTSFHYLPKPILNDTEGSSGYRMFVLETTLTNIFSVLGGEE